MQATEHGEERRASTKSKISKASRRSVISLQRRGSQIALQVKRVQGGQSQPLTATRLPELIDEIGMGWYHITAFVMLVFTPLAEGAGMIVMTNVTHALKHEFQLSDWQAGSLDAFSFSGLAVGHYIAGFLADLKGRRLPMILAYLGMTLTGIFMTMASGYKSVVFLRLLHGAACGLGVPPAMSMIAEIIPSSWRQLMFVIFWSFTAVGETYAAFGLILFMPELIEDCCWKQVVLWSTLPAALMLLLSIARLQDSPHWLAVRGRLMEARVVLDQMAAMNRKENVLKKLGPPPVHDLSGLYSNAAINSRAHASPGGETGHASPREILKILVQPAILKLVVLFSALASVGNIETFGMSNLWPEILRHEAVEAHTKGESVAASPAQKLALIVSLGIPVGVICALISFSKAASHRIYIMVAGVLGFAGILGVAAFLHAPAVLMAAMLVTHMSGTLGYAVAMIFCEESFPTDIRASATGIVIFWGTTWSVLSPLLLTAVGQSGFLAVAGVAFLVAVLAVQPLEETHGTELKDFVEDADEDDTDATEASSPSRNSQHALDEAEDSDESGMSLVEEGEAREHLSMAFANGTIGAAIELDLLCGLLGAVPGLSFTSFYASMGFLIDKCRDRSFFAKEMLLGHSVAVPMLLVMPSLGPWLDRKIGILRSLALRLPISIFSLCLVDLAMAFPEDEASMLAIGLGQSLLNVLVMGASSSLASKLKRSCLEWVRLGFTSAALLPVLTTPFTGFGPKSPLLVRLCFYLPPAFLCLLIAVVSTCYHGAVTKNFHNAPNRGNLKDLIQAYKALEDPQREDFPPPSTSLDLLNSRLASCMVLCYQTAAYFLAGLFPLLGDAAVAFTLFLYMITGDVMGNLVAFVWSAAIRLKDLEQVHVTFVSLSLLSLLAMGIALAPALEAVEVASGREGAPMPLGATVSLSFCTFFFGSFAKSSLEALSPSTRHARLLGSLLGLLSAVLCYALTNANEPPRLVHDHVEAPLAMEIQTHSSYRRPLMQVHVNYAGVLRREA